MFAAVVVDIIIVLVKVVVVVVACHSQFSAMFNPSLLLLLLLSNDSWLQSNIVTKSSQQSGDVMALSGVLCQGSILDPASRVSSMGAPTSAISIVKLCTAMWSYDHISFEAKGRRFNVILHSSSLDLWQPKHKLGLKSPQKFGARNELIETPTAWGFLETQIINDHHLVSSEAKQFFSNKEVAQPLWLQILVMRMIWRAFLQRPRRVPSLIEASGTVCMW